MGVSVGSVGDAGAAFWAHFVEVCRAASGVGVGRKALSGMLVSVGDAMPPEVAERLVPLVVRPEDEDGTDGPWLALMRGKGKIGDAEVRAAREIAYVLRLRAEVSVAAIPALDTTRVVVDGGPNPGARVYGMRCEPAVERYDAWVGRVKAQAVKQRVVRGRNEALSVLVLVQRVLLGDAGPNALDKTLGVRNGRCGEVVVRELRRYAALHFHT